MVVVYSDVAVFRAMKEDVIDCQAFLAGDTLWWFFSSQEVSIGEERVPNP